MQLDLFAMFAEADSRPAAQPVVPPVVQPVRKVHSCSMREFRECQEIESDFFSGRAAWLYKQIEREMASRAKAAKLENEVFAEGWK